MPRLLLIVAALAAALGWTLTRPPDFDEANFLVLARGALADPWRPHLIPINWQGTTQPAFEVLSNPPGIAWWLAPVLTLPTWAQRLWMLPWTGLAAWGALRLARRFAGDAEAGALLLLTSPMVLLSATALLPDAPLFGLCLAGLAGYVDAVEEDAPAWPWALVLGAAALFRYSAVALWPLVVLWPFLQRRRLAAGVWVALPLFGLALHDLHAYGRVHLLAMGSFQAVSNTPTDWAHKAVAALAFLGGVVVLPVYRWRPAHLGAAALGAAAAAAWGPVAAAFGALGGAALAPALLALVRDDPDAPRPAPDRVFLATWALLGAAFLLTLRFTAARYWLPFAPAIALLLPPAWPRLRLALGFGLGVLLATDDALHAQGDAALAQRVAALGTGRFTGHWGWQAGLEAAGWTALDEGSRPEPGTLVAVPTQAWPQPVSLRCDHVRWEGHAWPPFPWLPRGYSAEAGANLHANWVAAPTATRTVVPWWFANDAWESVRVCAE